MWQRCIQKAVSQAVASARSAGVQAAASRVLTNASSATAGLSSRKAGQSLAQSSVFRAFRQETSQVSMSARTAPCFAASAPSIFSTQSAAISTASSGAQARAASTSEEATEEGSGEAVTSTSSSRSCSATASSDEDEPGTSHKRKRLSRSEAVSTDSEGPGPPYPASLFLTHQHLIGHLGHGSSSTRAFRTSACAGAQEGESRAAGTRISSRPGRGDRPERPERSNRAEQAQGERPDRPGRGDRVMREDRPHDSRPQRGGFPGGGSSRGDRDRNGPGGYFSTANLQERQEDDTLELLVATKEAFMKKGIALDPAVREMLYQYRWDKVLVDVRRSVSLKPHEGKVEQYSAMVAVGNMKGYLGLGVADAPTAQEAVADAYLDAFRRLTPVALYRSHTIFHKIEHDYHFMKLILDPRPEGWGIKASELVTQLCNLAGIRNISIKVMGRRRSRFYVAAALLEALGKQSVPQLGVEGSGVYVREVFHKSTLPAGLVRGVDIN